MGRSTYDIWYSRECVIRSRYSLNAGGIRYKVGRDEQPATGSGYTANTGTAGITVIMERADVQLPHHFPRRLSVCPDILMVRNSGVCLVNNTSIEGYAKCLGEDVYVR